MRYVLYLMLVLAIILVGVFSFTVFSQKKEVIIYGELPARNLFPEEVIENDEKDEIVLIFTGDIMMDRAVKSQIMKNENDFRYPFLKISDFLNEADAVIGNMEGSISDKGEDLGGVYSFRNDPQTVEGLLFANFRVLSLANNHIWDWGAEALTDTVDRLEKAGIMPVGVGRNENEANAYRVLEIKNNKIAFFSHTNLFPEGLYARGENPGISDPDIERIKESIESAKEEVDVVVSLWHWGIEYETKSHPREQEIAWELIDAGVDLIVGHHPHVVQEIEIHNGKYIAYSLGNFVFDQYFSEETMTGILLKVVIEEGEVKSVQALPYRLTETYQPYLLKE